MSILDTGRGFLGPLLENIHSAQIPIYQTPFNHCHFIDIKCDNLTFSINVPFKLVNFMIVFHSKQFVINMEYESQLKQVADALEERLSNLRKRLHESESPENLMAATAFVFQPDTQKLKIQISPTRIEFYDASWREVLELIKKKEPVESFKKLIENLKVQCEAKSDISDLPDKASRQYVDTLLWEIGSSARSELDEELQASFSMIKAELMQAKSNVETIKEHFQANIEELRNELNDYRKSLMNVGEEQEVTLLHNVQPKQTPTHVHTHPRVQPTLMMTSPIKRPQIYRTPYRPRVKPFVPEDLTLVSHST